MNRGLTTIAMVAGLAAAGCARERDRPAGPAVTRDFPVGAFDRIEVMGPYDVDVRSGPAANVTARGEQRAIDRLVVEVDGTTLRIRPRESTGFRWTNHRKSTVSIVAPALRGADIAGSGTMKIDRVQGDSFAGHIAGSGDLLIQTVNLRALTLNIAGSGETRLGQGSVKTSALEIAGSGDIDARGVTSEALTVSVAGSGNVAARATGTAVVRVMGSGDVEVMGGAKCHVSKHGSGDVRCS